MSMLRVFGRSVLTEVITSACRRAPDLRPRQHLAAASPPAYTLRRWHSQRPARSALSRLALITGPRLDHRRQPRRAAAAAPDACRRLPAVAGPAPRHRCCCREGGAARCWPTCATTARSPSCSSEPSSNRTLQLKGSDATVAPCGPDDAALAERYLQGFIEEIGQLGLSAEVAHTILGHDGALVAVHFTHRRRPSSRHRARRPASRWQRRPAERMIGARTSTRSGLPGRRHPGRDGHLRRRRHAQRHLHLAGRVRRRQHLALSFQFFNKTRRNVLANPVVELLVIHPAHGAMYRIARALPAHRDRRRAVRAHEGQAGRHRLAHRHERGVQAARRRPLRGRPGRPGRRAAPRGPCAAA